MKNLIKKSILKKLIYIKLRKKHVKLKTQVPWIWQPCQTHIKFIKQ
jgi:hypothetical protein